MPNHNGEKFDKRMADKAAASKPSPNKFSQEVKETLLATYASGMNLGDTCRKIGISLQTVSTHRKTDIEFAKAFADAHDAFVDHVEQHAWQITQDKTSKAQATMIIFMLKSHRRETYGDRIQGAMTIGFVDQFAEAMQRVVGRTQPTAIH